MKSLSALIAREIGYENGRWSSGGATRVNSLARRVASMGVEINRGEFGTLADGRVVEVFTLTNAAGVSARVITYGATLQSLMMPDSNGTLADVVLGYPDLNSYVSKPAYLGPTIGRVANRIARGRFVLDGATYETVRNEGAHTLHGGQQGFDKALWRVVSTTSGA
jgi:aldose 1-epimerase